MQNTNIPYYKDMTDDELVAAYWSLRESTHKWGEMARRVPLRTREGRRVAREWGHADRCFLIVCGLLRNRGVSPLSYERSEA